MASCNLETNLEALETIQLIVVWTSSSLATQAAIFGLQSSCGNTDLDVFFLLAISSIYLSEEC